MTPRAKAAGSVSIQGRVGRTSWGSSPVPRCTRWVRGVIALLAARRFEDCRDLAQSRGATRAFGPLRRRKSATKSDAATMHRWSELRYTGFRPQ